MIIEDLENEGLLLGPDIVQPTWAASVIISEDQSQDGADGLLFMDSQYSKADAAVEAAVEAAVVSEVLAKIEEILVSDVS